MLSTIRATAGAAARTDQQRIGLHDVDLGLQQGGADFQERLRPLGQFDADQIALDDRQAGPLQNLSPLLGVAQQEANQGAFGRVGDRQGHDPHAAPLESANHFQQLPYPILQERS